MSDRRTASLSAGTIGVLAVVAGGAIANNYVIQPSIAAIATDLGTSQSAISLTLSGLMVGYLAGLMLFVPLADRTNPKRLVPLHLLALAATLVAASSASSSGFLFASLACVGAMATVAAQTSAIVGKLASSANRGRQMGVISAGISAGILLSRFIGGVLADRFGWRIMLLCFAAFSGLMAMAAWTTLPDRPVKTQPKPIRPSALRSISASFTDFPNLRWAVVAGMFWFAAFSAIWVGLAIELAQPPRSQSAEAIGFYSLAGLLGLLVTPLSGRLVDRFGSEKIKLAGLTAAAAALGGLYFALDDPPMLMLLLAIFDAGCFSAQVANQSGVVRLAPDRAGALMSTYMLLYYLAGAIGTAAAGPLVAFGGWPLLIGVATLAIIGAILASLQSIAVATVLRLLRHLAAFCKRLMRSTS